MAKLQTKYSNREEQSLMTEIFDPAIADDPLAFVRFVFPWGKKGTPLENFKGPRKWQIEVLSAIREHIADNKRRIINGQPPEVFKMAVASGRGIGKSSLVAWLNLWFLSTRLGGTGVTTANTEAQLKSRTWAELGKWHTLAINGHWFERTALSLKPAEWFETLLKNQLQVDTGYFYAMAQLWSEENPDAFAGIHSQNGIMLIFDEASGIPAPIWKVSEGFFTDKILHRYHLVFSNPRRNTGEFFECFHKYRNYWIRRHIDSRTVEGLDKKVFDDIVAKYGDDSDEAAVEVKGTFPRQGDNQFISRSVVSGAVEREVQDDAWAPLMMGVDPARFGDDTTVIRFRQGRNARVIPPVKLKGHDNMAVSNKCAELIMKYNPDAVCVDAGNGVGIIDRLREMGFKVHEVWFGSSSPEPEYSNFRTYMWAKLREWLHGGCIDDDQDLVDDLTAPEYKFQGTSDKIMLESKESLKKRGFSSPDNADALACTFAVKVARKDVKAAKGFGKNRMAADIDYKLFN